MTTCVNDKCQHKPACEHACNLRVQHVSSVLQGRDEAATVELQRIGSAIGYGNAQSILGGLWDEMLMAEYGVANRGGMGVTVNERAAYRNGWDDCVKEWAKHMERVAKAMAKKGQI